MSSSQPIVLTGVNGFCASRLYRFLKEKEQVIGLSHRDMDITDMDACHRLVRKLRPKAIIHSAAISRMDECEKDPELSFRVNVLGPENLAKACADAGIRLIHFSTDQVYNGCKDAGPHPEETHLAPGNVYGKHKKEAEVRIAAQTDDFAAIRLTWMYDFPVRGIYTSQNLLTICQKALYTNTLLTFSSTSGRGITFVHEVIENIPVLLNAPSGIYNFGSCSDMSTYDTAKLIFAQLGAGQRIAELLQPENEPAGKYPDLRMNCAKAAAQGMLFSTTEYGLAKAFKEYGYQK